jgi:hypothetical protein
MSELPWGMVKITDGKLKGRIGYFDDEEIEDGIEYGFVYFGRPGYNEYHVIPVEYLTDDIDTNDLFNRQFEIHKLLVECHVKKDYKYKAELFSELLYTEGMLNEKYINSRYLKAKRGKKVFLSHSSRDKTFVRILATDLIENGHDAWLDEWEIVAGESIPKKISQGLDECDYVILILSQHSVDSSWVEKEWESVYWDEVNEGKIKVIPILIDNCLVPRLLKTKKYIQFMSDYKSGMDDLLYALK